MKGQSAHRAGLLLVIWLMAALVATSALGATLPLNYGGRLTTSDGAPVAGPVELQVGFFGSATGGTALRAPIELRNVALAQGVFQVELGLTQGDLDAFFGGGGAVFVEVKDVTHGKTYPRQRLGAVPYALRVPVDGSSIVYDGSGNLSVGAVDAAKVTGLSAMLADMGDAAKLQGVPLSTGTPAAGAVLTFSGGQWQPVVDSGVLTQHGNAAPGVAPTGEGRIYFDSSSNQFMVSQNGGAYAPLGTVTGGTITQVSAGAGLTGGGTTGNVTVGLPNVGTAGTYTRVLTDAYGRVTAGGTLTAVDLPMIPVGLISGSLPVTQLAGTLAASQVPVLSATQIQGGTLAAAVIPQLSAAVITSGTLASAQIPQLSAGQITSGTFAAAQIPALDAGKITTGQLAVADGGTGANSFTNNGVVIGAGAGPLAATTAGTQYQVLTVNGAGQPVFGSLNLNQSAAVSGTLPVANGGTGSGTALGNNRLMISSGGAIVEAPALGNGQLLIGSAGAAPVAATMAQGTTQGVTVTTGAGSLTLDTAQDIRTSATPQFANLKLTGPGTGSLLKVGTGGTLAAAAAADLTSLVAGAFVQKAGDTMTGALTLPADGLVVGAGEIQTMSGRVGINTTSPGNELTVATGPTTGLGIEADRYAAATGSAPGLQLSKSLSDTPGAQALNNVTDAQLGKIIFAPSTGTSFSTTAAILAFAGPGGHTSASNMPTYLTFLTTPVGSGVPSERVRIAETGYVGIGTVSPGTTLDLAGALTERGIAAPAAAPAGQGRLYFDAVTNQFLVSQNGGAYSPLSTLTALGTAGSYTKVATDAYGRVTAGSALTVSDLPAIPTSQLSGTLAAAQVAAIPTSQITGTLAAAQVAAIPVTQITGTLAAAQVASIPTSQITGTLAAAQVAAIPTTQITGTLAASQVAPIPTTKLTGTLAASQVDWSTPGAIGAATPNSGSFTTLLASGNVGFGTTSPTDPVTVMRSVTNATGAGIGIYNASSVTSSGTYYGIGLEVSNTMTINSGVTNGGYLAGVNADIVRNGAVDTGTLAETHAVRAQFGHYDATARTTTDAFGVLVVPYFGGGTIKNSYGVYLSSSPTTGATVTNNFGFFAADPTAKNYFGGAVGIGTISPASMLHVVAGGSVGQERLETTSDTLNAVLELKDNSPGQARNTGINFLDNTNNARGQVNYSMSGRYMNFNTNSAERLRIDANGNVGIGTTSPGAKLHVAGTAGTDGIEFPDGSLQTTAAPIGAIGIGSARSLVAIGTTSAVRVTAARIVLVDAATETKGLVARNVDVTATLATAGPVANGRDSAAALVADWYYVWLISNGTTTAALFSSSATAPTLPSGYTHRAFVSAVYNTAAGSASLRTYYQYGGHAFYPDHVAGRVLSGGTSTAWNALDSTNLGLFVPPVATQVDLWQFCNYTAGASTSGVCRISVDAGNSVFSHSYAYYSTNAYGTFLVHETNTATVPLPTPQTVWWSNSAAALDHYLDVQGFFIE